MGYPKYRRSDRLARCFRQVIVAQAMLTVAVMIIAALAAGLSAVLSSLLGAVLAMVNTWITQRSIQKSSDLAYATPDMAMLPVFSGLVQRLLVFATGILVGVLLLQLLPLYILVGFIVLQLGYLACKMT